MTLQKVHRVVVLGAGYAGLPAAKRLARQVFPDEVDVTLVSAGPDFVERPRLHQIATGQRVAQWMFRHPGPYVRRRSRHVNPEAAQPGLSIAA